MRRVLLYFSLLLFCSDIQLCQEAAPSIVNPPDGYIFTDNERLCVSVDADPFTWGILYFRSPFEVNEVNMFNPYIPDLDNGYCMPRQFKAWDTSFEFSVGFCEPSDGCAEQADCSLQPSGSETPPANINLKEVSFRKKKKKYYLRLVTDDLISDSSCIEVKLGEKLLPITRYEIASGLATIEALIGNQDEFVQIASNTPILSFKDICSQKEYYSPSLPAGKEQWESFFVGYVPSKKIVAIAGAYFTPITGCEVLFYSWYDAKNETWAMKNYPSYDKYSDTHGPSGYLPHRYRKIWKPGILVFRIYDYCTGEFVGFCLGCSSGR